MNQRNLLQMQIGNTKFLAAPNTMKKNTQPQHEQTARKHILRTEEFIRFLIAMTIGGMLVF